MIESSLAEANSEPCETSNMEFLAKQLTAFRKTLHFRCLTGF